MTRASDRPILRKKGREHVESQRAEALAGAIVGATTDTQAVNMAPVDAEHEPYDETQDTQTSHRKHREIQTELLDLRRRIAELEHEKQSLEQQVSYSSTAADVSTPVTTSEELTQTLQTFVRRVAMILQAEKCVIMLYDSESGELVAQHPALKLTDEEVSRLHVLPSVGLSGEAFRDGHPIICHDCKADARAKEDGLDKLGIRDALTVPMMIERRNENQQVVERTIIGVIHVLNKRYGLKFAEEDTRLLTVLARNAAAVISSARAIITITAEKKQLEYTLHSMTSGLLVVSRGERIQLMNAAAARILGLETVDGIGRSFRQVIVNGAVTEFLSHALEEEHEIVKEFVIGERFFQGQSAMVRDEKRAILGLLVVFNDVTELRNVERMKSDFVSTVSHELRTPLTSIQGFVRTLLDDPSGEFYDQDTRMEFYGIIDSECDRLVRLISDLLNVSRIENGRPLHVNYDTVDIGALIEKCLNFQRNYSENHELKMDVPTDLPTVVADKDKVDQIITNLVSNAIKYSPDGGSVTVSARDEGEKLCISVTDEGIGIPPEHLDKIFQRFHRVNAGDAQRVGGTGIGLYLVRSLVEAHGGVAWVESTVGKGSVFSFTLPKKPPANVLVEEG
jgi:PAS domain S-box-containing protein